MFDTCLILAGGKGSRLYPYTKAKPKPLVEINNTPFINFIIEHLHSYGISNIILLTGYLSEQFDEIISTYSKTVGLSIRNIPTEPSLNTASRVAAAKKYLEGDVLVCYGDVLSEINLTEYYNFYKSHPNSICSASALSRHNNLSLAQVLNTNLPVIEKYKDIGFISFQANYLIDNIKDNIDLKFEDYINTLDFDRFIYIDRWIYCSLTDSNSLNSFKRQVSEKPTLILDRDGVINKAPKKGTYVKNKNELIISDSFKQLISSIENEIERIIVLTNQPWVGNIEENIRKHDEIKEEIINALSFKKNKIFYLYCPHSYAMRCFCRKPKTGNLLKFIQYKSILRRKMIFIGDSITDAQTAALMGEVSFFDVKYINTSIGKVKFEQAIKTKLCTDNRYYRLCGLPHGRFDS
ncbi:hypothetical protein CL656_05135 [bacterium]|nr:hypothetical protein [bacterium]|tara:strand:+ start:7476 stop:8696 length:1221 start_codon:yes stop_codon:yes gene_type:complete